MLCIPIIARDTESAINKISNAEKLADLTEIRLDLMESFQLGRIIKAADKPVIVTYRSEKEGGKGKADPSIVTDYLTIAASEKADFIDVELGMPEKWKERIIQNRHESRIIVSSHIMDKTPSMEDLNSLLDDSILSGNDLVKIVTRANKWEDNLRILELVAGAREREINIIAFCMGAMGRMSRIFSLLTGGFLTFTSVESGQESAPGQIPVNEMKNMLEYFSV